jgi:phosphopantetheinyl transferase (holo-ACP synthase)
MPTGNDIVHLLGEKCANRYQDTRFLDKVFSSAEQEMILRCNAPNLMLWLCWSVKEAAYKLHSRLALPDTFAPKKIPVTNTVTFLPAEKDAEKPGFHQQGFDNTPFIQSEVSIKGIRFFARSTYSSNYVHSIVCERTEDFEKVCWGINLISSPVYADQSAGVRNFASIALKEILSLSDNHRIEYITNTNSYPELWIDGIKNNLALSFSHHDCLVSYAFLL